MNFQTAIETIRNLTDVENFKYKEEAILAHIVENGSATAVKIAADLATNDFTIQERTSYIYAMTDYAETWAEMYSKQAIIQFAKALEKAFSEVKLKPKSFNASINGVEIPVLSRGFTNFIEWNFYNAHNELWVQRNLARSGGKIAFWLTVDQNGDVFVWNSEPIPGAIGWMLVTSYGTMNNRLLCNVDMPKPEVLDWRRCIQKLEFPHLPTLEMFMEAL